jgi:4-aminobutyrate aminotransferase
MIGIEIVKDPQSREAAGAWRDRIVELAFERGLLILGCGETSIRLAPALIVNEQEASIALDILEECVALTKEEHTQKSALAESVV